MTTNTAIFEAVDFEKLEARAQAHNFQISETNLENRVRLNLQQIASTDVLDEGQMIQNADLDGETQLFHLSRSQLTFDHKVCCVVTLKNVTKLKQISELETRNKFLGLMSSSINHEYLAPIRCISQISKQLEKSVRFKEKESARVISNTADFVLSQIQTNMDSDLLERGHF